MRPGCLVLAAVLLLSGTPRLRAQEAPRCFEVTAVDVEVRSAARVSRRGDRVRRSAGAVTRAEPGYGGVGRRSQGSWDRGPR